MDKATNIVSHFNVIEEIEFRETSPPEGMPTMIRPLFMQITAVWMRAEGDDPTQEYEFEISLSLPPDGTKSLAGNGTVKFDRPRFRVNAYVQGLYVQGLMPKGSGTFVAECRMRPLGGDESSWVVQTYAIPLVHIEHEAAGRPEPLSGESTQANCAQE
ncbi:MAG: hypothetical protein ACLQGP_34130 [Isosphaeraceae bacterium]